MSLPELFNLLVEGLEKMDDLLFPNGVNERSREKITYNNLRGFVDEYLENTQFTIWGCSSFYGPKGGIYCSEDICLKSSKERIGTIYADYFDPIENNSIDYDNLAVIEVRIRILNPEYRDFLTTFLSVLENYLGQKVSLENPFLDS